MKCSPKLPVTILQQLGSESFEILCWKLSKLLASDPNILAACPDLVAGSLRFWGRELLVLDKVEEIAIRVVRMHSLDLHLLALTNKQREELSL